MRGFTGPFGVFVRSYAYIRAYGPALREMSEAAVLNANYLLARLKDAYDLPFDRLCMHEFVLSARTLKREHGVSALDVAKRLMDYGIHPPTVYFPLIVPEALMIEPTETEPKERLDEFCEAMLAIAHEAAANPEVVHEAPHNRPVGRLDEVKAAKRAVVRYLFEDHPDLSEPAAGAGRGAEGGLAWIAASASGSSASTRRASTTLLERRLADRLDEDLEGSPVARQAARAAPAELLARRRPVRALARGSACALAAPAGDRGGDRRARGAAARKRGTSWSSSTATTARGSRARGVRWPDAGASTPSTS